MSKLAVWTLLGLLLWAQPANAQEQPTSTTGQLLADHEVDGSDNDLANEADSVDDTILELEFDEEAIADAFGKITQFQINNVTLMQELLQIPSIRSMISSIIDDVNPAGTPDQSQSLKLAAVTQYRAAIQTAITKLRLQIEENPDPPRLAPFFADDGEAIDAMISSLKPHMLKSAGVIEELMLAHADALDAKVLGKPTSVQNFQRIELLFAREYTTITLNHIANIIGMVELAEDPMLTSVLHLIHENIEVRSQINDMIIRRFDNGQQADVSDLIVIAMEHLEEGAYWSTALEDEYLFFQAGLEEFRVSEEEYTADAELTEAVELYASFVEKLMELYRMVEDQRVGMIGVVGAYEAQNTDAHIKTLESGLVMADAQYFQKSMEMLRLMQEISDALAIVNSRIQ